MGENLVGEFMPEALKTPQEIDIDLFVQDYLGMEQDTIANLAHEFDVSVRTIKYNIEELTLAYPIETIRGRYGGGVKVADGYYIGRRYLKPNQQELLKRLSEQLTDEDKAVMDSILRDFAL